MNPSLSDRWYYGRSWATSTLGDALVPRQVSRPLGGLLELLLDPPFHDLGRDSPSEVGPHRRRQRM